MGCDCVALSLSFIKQGCKLLVTCGGDCASLLSAVSCLGVCLGAKSSPIEPKLWGSGESWGWNVGWTSLPHPDRHGPKLRRCHREQERLRSGPQGGHLLVGMQMVNTEIRTMLQNWEIKPGNLGQKALACCFLRGSKKAFEEVTSFSKKSIIYLFLDVLGCHCFMGFL